MWCNITKTPTAHPCTSPRRLSHQAWKFIVTYSWVPERGGGLNFKKSVTFYLFVHRSTWTYLYQTCSKDRGCWHNHLWQISWRSAKGFNSVGGSKVTFSPCCMRAELAVENWSSPLLWLVALYNSLDYSPATDFWLIGFWMAYMYVAGTGSVGPVGPAGPPGADGSPGKWLIDSRLHPLCWPILWWWVITTTTTTTTTTNDKFRLP